MSIRYQLREFYDTTLDRSEDFGFQVANQVRRAICSVWSVTPGALIPNPGDSFRRGAISSLCQDSPPPPPPVAPFTGGQCPGVNYNVAVGVGFTVRSNNQVVPPTNPGVRTGPFLGPISPRGGREGDLYVWRNATDGKVLSSVNVQSNKNPVIQLYDIQRVGGGPDNCGNPAPRYPGSDYIDDRDTIIEGDTIVEGDENNPITIDISPTFEDEVCIGQFVFCADVEGNRVTLDVGGVTINLPGTGGGEGSGGGGNDSETITNIDNRTTIIQQQQEDCCEAIQLLLNRGFNSVIERLIDAELRDACIVGLIRNSAQKVPKLTQGQSVRASGTAGMLGSVVYVQPQRANSCFLFIEVTPTEGYTGRKYKLLPESNLVERSLGHVEIVFGDGTTVPPAQAGIQQIFNRKTLVWFPYISSGNQIRLSLAGNVNYTVIDPGFTWEAGDLPTCEEVVDPGP